MDCFFCGNRISRPWGTFVRNDKRAKPKLHSIYCSKECAEYDAVDPVFRGCIIKRIGHKEARDFYGED